MLTVEGRKEGRVKKEYLQREEKMKNEQRKHEIKKSKVEKAMKKADEEVMLLWRKIKYFLFYSYRCCARV